MIESQSELVKSFYRSRSETNWVKRYQSPYGLRRYFSRTMWQVISECVGTRSMVLDAGCGDGVLSVILALRRPETRIIAMDISEDGVREARAAAIAHGVADQISFVVADAENLPFGDSAFPCVVSSQVLEHLMDFDNGVKEIRRVLKDNGVGVIAVPACLNPSAMVLLGGDNYWRISKRTPFAVWKGLGRVVKAWFQGKEGVQEGYAGHMELPHVRRFPWLAQERFERNGLKVTQRMADSLLIPYFAFLFPWLIGAQKWLDERLRSRAFWRNFGVGVVMIVQRKP